MEDSFFHAHLGHFEYLAMLIVLTNAPAVFQALVNDLLRDMLDKIIFVYIDGIFIFFSCSFDEHVNHA